MALNIIFDGPPGVAHDGAAIQPDGGRFIDTENDFGESIKAGEWSENGDGTWTLRIEEMPAAAERHRHVAGPDGDIDTCLKCGKDLRSRIHLRVGESV